MKRLAVAAAAVLAAGGLAASVAMAGVDRGGSAPPEWLQAVNAYRASASLSPVDEELTWSGEAAEHARYQVVNGVVSSQQEPGAPFASIGGAEAARNADLAGISGSELAGREAVDLWMTNPFHALGILRPRLDRVGYGAWHDDDPASPVQAAAVLDVVRGIGPREGAATPLVRWPGPGSVVPLTSYAGHEDPDPLAACGADFSAPTGLPIIVLFPTETQLSQATVTVDGQLSETCVVDQDHYDDPDPAAADVGRKLLAGDHAAVVIPRHPLPIDADVDVSVDTTTGNLSWSFRTTSRGGPVLPASAAD